MTAAPGRVGAVLRKALDNGASPFDLGLKIGKRHDPSVAELEAAGLSMIQFHFSGTEVTDGSRRIFGPGDLLRAEDTEGTGQLPDRPGPRSKCSSCPDRR